MQCLITFSLPAFELLNTELCHIEGLFLNKPSYLHYLPVSTLT
jgi:hypothetical protein